MYAIARRFVVRAVVSFCWLLFVIALFTVSVVTWTSPEELIACGLNVWYGTDQY